MTTITATPNTATGAIVLEITQTGSIRSITRSNANGVESVRVAAGQIPSATTGVTIVTDYEGAVGPNSYTVTTTADTATATATLMLDSAWLLVPIAPNYSEPVSTITDYSAGRETNSTLHTIIGRSDPIVVMGKLGTRTGSLEIWTDSLTDANRLVRVFDRGEAVLLKQTVPGMDMYFTATGIDVSPYSVQGDATKFRMAVSYQEVARPYGNLAGALGWTFDALASSYSSFDAVAAAFANFDDLTIQDTL
ncbi:hypothetical protein PSET11_03033 [Arthrobacter ulcerisalmonis]|uniref:Uncharacterized protein n=1 Tax=Arthrobacter ulcerisalmonis TaxID=2483813 RepID=A0A3P5XBS5_9MICC|nr:hypothetical protein [Arthrobacter ulcerisalmonis]VDC32265.1 hypothetical protein PSET11_03033 [Arthrobacter ulcerisalmonis]